MTLSAIGKNARQLIQSVAKYNCFFLNGSIDQILHQPVVGAECYKITAVNLRPVPAVLLLIPLFLLTDSRLAGNA